MPTFVGQRGISGVRGFANGQRAGSAAPAHGGSGTPTSYPPDTTIATVTQPSQSLPTYLVSYTEGSINGSGGAKVIRVTNVAGRRNGYSVRQPWSANGAYLLMERGGSPSYPGRLLDGTTYADLGACAWGDPRWANKVSDAANMYNVTGSGLYHTDRFGFNGTATLVKSFSGSITIGGGEGNADDTDRYWPIIVNDTSIQIYDQTGNTVVGTKAVTAGTVDNVKVSHSGAYVSLSYGDQGGTGTGSGATQGALIWDRTLTTNYGQATQGGGFHEDWCIDSDGSDVFVGAATAAQLGGANDLWSKWAILGGSLVRTTLIPTATAWNRGHISGRAIDRPGWAYLSSYDGTSALALHNQIGAVKLDGSGTVEIWAFDHNTNPNGAVYDRSPFGCPNRDGTRIAYAADHGSGSWYGFVTGMTV